MDLILNTNDSDCDNDSDSAASDLDFSVEDAMAMVLTAVMANQSRTLMMMNHSQSWSEQVFNNLA